MMCVFNTRSSLLARPKTLRAIGRCEDRVSFQPIVPLLRMFVVALVLLAVRNPFVNAEEMKEAVRVDRYGDPLPEGAISRFGTIRLRHDVDSPECIVFSPDSKLIVSVSSYPDKTVRAWSVATGKPLWRIEREVFCVAFSPEGKLLACGGGSGNSTLLDPKSGRVVSDIACDAEVRALAFSPDGARIALATQHDGLRVVSSELNEVGERRQFFRAATKTLEQVVFAPNGEWIVCAGVGRYWLCDANNGSVIKHWTYGESRISGISIDSANESLFAVAGDRALQWRLPDPDNARVIQSSNAVVVGAAGEKLLSAFGLSKSEWLVQDMPQKKQTRLSPPAHFGRAAFTGDGKLVAIFSARIQLYDTETGKSLHELSGGFIMDDHSQFSPNAKLFASSSELWDVATGAPQHSKLGEGERIVFAPTGMPIAITFDQTKVRSRALGNVGPGLEVAAQNAYLSPSAGRIVIRSHVDGLRDTPPAAVEVWNLFTGGRELSISREPVLDLIRFDRASRIAISDTGRFAAAATFDGSMQLFTIPKGPSLRSSGILPELRNKRNAHVMFSPNGEYVAAIQCDRSLVVQMMPTSNLDEPITVKDDVVDDSVYPPSIGAAFLTNPPEFVVLQWIHGETHRATLKTWDCETGRLSNRIDMNTKEESRRVVLWLAMRGLLGNVTSTLQRLPPRNEFAFDLPTSLSRMPWFSAVAISQSGELAAFGYDRSVAIYETMTHRLITTFGVDAAFRDLRFSRDGNLLLVRCANGCGLVFEVTPLEKTLATRPLGELLSDLSGHDANTARRAIRELARRGDGMLRAIDVDWPRRPDIQQIRNLIAELDDNEFAKREAAERRLTDFGHPALPFLSAALRDSPSVEKGARLNRIVLKASGPVVDPSVVRAVRAIQVAELIGSDAASDLLERVAASPCDRRVSSRATTAASRLQLFAKGDPP